MWKGGTHEGGECEINEGGGVVSEEVACVGHVYDGFDEEVGGRFGRKKG